MNNAIKMFFDKLKQDSSFTNKIANTKEASEVQQLAKEQGIELTLDDLNEIRDIVKQVKAAKISELSEDELENVAGGASPAVSATVASAVATAEFSINRCETVISGGGNVVSAIGSAVSGW